MNSQVKKTSLRQRFWIIIGSLLFIIVMALAFTDISIRNDSKTLSNEASRIDKSVLSSFNGSRQMRADDMGVKGLWDKIARCTTGTLCDSYNDNYIAVPVEAGKEAEFLNRIVQAAGYSEVALDVKDCHFLETEICGANLVKDRFHLMIYIQPQPDLSNKDIAPLVWRNVHLNLTFK
jgi:hypothetical protein